MKLRPYFFVVATLAAIGLIVAPQLTQRIALVMVGHDLVP